MIPRSVQNREDMNGSALHYEKDPVRKSRKIRPPHILESLAMPQRFTSHSANRLFRGGDETLGHIPVASGIPQRSLFQIAINKRMLFQREHRRVSPGGD